MYILYRPPTLIPGDFVEVTLSNNRKKMCIYTCLHGRGMSQILFTISYITIFMNMRN